MTHPNEYYNGQALQDKFVLNILKYKRNGFFLEIGSNDPYTINNTYLLEKEYNWTGIMIDYNPTFLPLYKSIRPNSSHIIYDASAINYDILLKQNNFPLNIDYLQIDLEPGNGSTLKTLQNLDTNIFDTYKFATVTFEHDICNGENEDSIFHITRKMSRDIFERRGYVRVFDDVNNDGWRELEERRSKIRNGEHAEEEKIHATSIYPFEDWYVHPDLIDISYVNTLMNQNISSYRAYPNCDPSINYAEIKY